MFHFIVIIFSKFTSLKNTFFLGALDTIFSFVEGEVSAVARVPKCLITSKIFDAITAAPADLPLVALASCLPACLPACPPQLPESLLDFRPAPDLSLSARGAVRGGQGRSRGVAVERSFPVVPFQREELLARILDAAFDAVSRL